MTRILALDVASCTGYALHDTDRPPSAIVSGSLKFVGDSAFEKVADMRRKLPKLIREYQPDFCILEAPLSHIPTFKKTRKDMFGEEEEVSTINPGTICMLNQLAGAAHMCVAGQNIPHAEVRPRTWQGIIPDTIRGPTKKRVAEFCSMLKVVSPNQDSRDAVVIAIWAAGHCQELRMMQRAGVAA